VASSIEAPGFQTAARQLTSLRESTQVLDRFCYWAEAYNARVRT
jgi:hypothetical protein